MTADEFATAIEGKVEFRDVQVRQVVNGYVFVATRRFHDPDTGTQAFSLGLEGVAATTADLTGALGRFFENGDPTGQSLAENTAAVAGVHA